MKELGLVSRLQINRFTDFGAYLALSDGEEVLLPKGYLTGEEIAGDEVIVFVYTDSEDRPVAVTDTPALVFGSICGIDLQGSNFLWSIYGLGFVERSFCAQC